MNLTRCSCIKYEDFFNAVFTFTENRVKTKLWEKATKTYFATAAVFSIKQIKQRRKIKMLKRLWKM